MWFIYKSQRHEGVERRFCGAERMTDTCFNGAQKYTSGEVPLVFVPYHAGTPGGRPSN